MTVDFALIEQLGINRVAEALNVSTGAVRRWRSRGVPKERHAAIAGLAGMDEQDHETGARARPMLGQGCHAASRHPKGIQTKQPVRLNRKAVMIVGAGLASALVIGLANGTIQKNRVSPSLQSSREDREPTYLPLGNAYLPAFDYSNLSKQAVLPVVTELPKETELSPASEPSVVTKPRVAAPEHGQQSAEEEAALQSPLFPNDIAASRPTTTLASAGSAASNDPTLAALDRLRNSLPTPQDLYPQSQGSTSATDRQEAFLNARLDEAIHLKSGLQKPLSAFEIKAGTIIPTALVTGLNSNLPGEIIGQVTEHVFDTRSGQHLLIPQGSKIIGRYNADIGYGQDRAQIVWDRLIMPNGNSIQLEAMVGTDKAGYAGLSDQVDHHLGRLIGAVILSSFISVGANLATDSGNNVTDALGDAAAQQAAAQVGSQIVDRQLEVQPTITVRPGFRLNILVAKDLVLEPYTAQ